jgi:RND family efflux transporter MFP subunit
MLTHEEGTSKVYQLYRLAYSLIFCRSLQEILESAAKELMKAVEAKNAVLWVFSPSQGALEPAVAHLSEKTIKTRSVGVGSDYLGEVFRSGKPLLLKPEVLLQPNKHILFPKDSLPPETGLCVPAKSKPELQGVLELIGRSGSQTPFTEENVDFITKGLDLVAVAASNMKSYEEQSRNQLNAITRLTLLYDISQIFNSTLELDGLLPIITEKIRDILDAETCTILFLNEAGDELRVAKSTGAYQDILESYRTKLEDDIAGETVQLGEGILLEDASQDDRFSKRFANLEETPVYTYISAPLECKGKIIGAVEVINRTIDKLYNEEDQFLLNDLAHQAAISVHNANLLLTERKAKELDALLTISHEITSTLNLDKVLLTIVNQSATLIPYERAAIALQEKNKVDLRAVSGRMEVDKRAPDMRDLQDLLTWAGGLGKGLYISEYNGQIATDREETREKFKRHFEKTNMKSFVSLPLKDEEGDLGILSFESGSPYFLDERHLEVASILANQATVAIRNAQLYRQVPLIDIMAPFMQRKAKLMKMPKHKKMVTAAVCALILAILFFVPWNMKVMGDVTVLPQRRTPVISEVEGIIQKINVREGAQVNKGDVLSQLQDQDYRLALEEQKTRRDLLLQQISQSRSTGDSAALRLQQIQHQQAEREIDYYQLLVNRARIVAPVSGVVITPKLEEKVGSFLEKGDQFCELANMHQTRAEVYASEGDVGYLEEGQKIKLKMNAYPTKSFYGNVTLLGTQLTTQSEDQVYRVEAQIENTDLLLKSGMVGTAKIETGYRSIGYVLLRKPFRFLWKKFWVWLP